MTYGLSARASQHWGEKILQDLTAAHFLIPENFSDDDDPFTYFNPTGLFADIKSAARLRRGVLDGELEAVITNLPLNLNLPPDRDSLNRGRYLLDAVEHPQILQTLLGAGVDVRVENEFGKTSLMVAAHMNRPDSIQLLLKAGADPNATTINHNDCGYDLFRTNRTALMYAAENADIEVMRLLVDGGANIDAKDSVGNDVHYYLSLNPYLTAAQKQMSLKQLLLSFSESSTSAPSFDCTVAKQRIESLICKDQILARQDLSLASTFTAWMNKAESAQREKADELAWLKRRAEHCQSVKDEAQAISCLQLVTRARIRYLHNRITE